MSTIYVPSLLKENLTYNLKNGRVPNFQGPITHTSQTLDQLIPVLQEETARDFKIEYPFFLSYLKGLIEKEYSLWEAGTFLPSKETIPSVWNLDNPKEKESMVIDHLVREVYPFSRKADRTCVTSRIEGQQEDILLGIQWFLIGDHRFINLIAMEQQKENGEGFGRRELCLELQALNGIVSVRPICYTEKDQIGKNSICSTVAPITKLESLLGIYGKGISQPVEIANAFSLRHKKF